MFTLLLTLLFHLLFTFKSDRFSLFFKFKFRLLLKSTSSKKRTLVIKICSYLSRCQSLQSNFLFFFIAIFQNHIIQVVIIMIIVSISNLSEPEKNMMLQRCITETSTKPPELWKSNIWVFLFSLRNGCLFNHLWPSSAYMLWLANSISLQQNMCVCVCVCVCVRERERAGDRCGYSDRCTYLEWVA